MLKDKYELKDLLEIMALLRSEKGCPWDREQTHESLKRYLIEETYEVLEAIDLNSSKKMCEELGDLLLQVVFQAQIASEKNAFNMQDVITAICRKLILRHTHVFGNDKADTPEEVVNNWEAIKKKEKGIKSHTEVLKDVPSNLPALMRSFKVQQKASQVGFDLDNAEDVFDKVLEEIQELKDVYKSKNVARITDEMGDVFFSLVNLSRFLDVQPELALSETTNKFIKRFEYIEKEALKSGKNLEEMTLSEMDKLWNEAKIHISGKKG
ncbi:MAG: nucleoside triphosphate pyrophosphohydrolase [Clostridiales bacterium]|nr:nucleoside triphosphate pyrophosphohydrolase [Eubacteriales bacterium]MDH7567005.1 nucleoside triphosphate pyrophosphohydrolase [Clostridiales bacterium]